VQAEADFARRCEGTTTSTFKAERFPAAFAAVKPHLANVLVIELIADTDLAKSLSGAAAAFMLSCSDTPTQQCYQ
jgi:hypothetical protein